MLKIFRGVRHVLVGAATTIAILSFTSCSDDDSSGPTTAPLAASLNSDLSVYDAFVIGSSENNPLFADVYGIRMQPFSIDRVTTDKRISSMGADPSHVIVSAADTDVDRLASVRSDGALLPVDGLGRPHAFTPRLAADRLYYEVPVGDTDASRFFSWNLRSRERSKLFEAAGIGGLTPAGGGRFLLVRSATTSGGVGEVVLREGSKELTSTPFAANAIGFEVGRQWIATTINAPDNSFGNKPESVSLLNRKSGRVQRVEGLQSICWTPDGTRLLARRTTSPGASELVLLDPAKPDQLTEVGSVPNLVIYSGTWLRGNP